MRVKPNGIPELVAELSISLNSLDVQVDISALASVRAKGESEGVRSTFWDSIGVVSGLAFLCLLDLFRIEIAGQKSFLEFLESDSVNNISWINDVSKRFRHFSTMRISDHCMKVDFLEWKLIT